MKRLLALPLLVAAVAACDRQPPASTATPAAPAAGATATPTTSEIRIGDAVVNATFVQTSTVPASVAQEHGIERSDRIAMLLVNARGADGGPAPDGLSVEAAATPSDGRTQPIELREVNAGDSLDRVGTIAIAPPETVRVDVTVRYGTSTSSMSITRDFYPR